MRVTPFSSRRVGLVALSFTVFSVGSLAADKQEVRSGLKPALKILPIAEPVAPEAVTGAAAAVPQRFLPKLEFLDPANPGAHLLQRYDDAVRGLPLDGNGFPDWMKALNERKIEPRSGLKDADRMEVLDLDVVMRNTREMPNVRFPHRSHTLWLACSNCHPQPFTAKAGGNAIAMADIFRGRYCGMCHDRVAFVTFFSCYRCHNVPQQTGQQDRLDQ